MNCICCNIAHLAFWDQRGLGLLEKWQKAGVSPSPMDVDMINDAVHLFCLALAPRAAAQLAVSCAQAIDAAIDVLELGFLAEVGTNGLAVRRTARSTGASSSSRLSNS